MKLNPAAFVWYAVTTAPQREKATQALLDREGFATFLPVRKEYSYRNKYDRARRQKSESTYALLPGYVFLGMSGQTPGWERVFCFVEKLTGKITAGGTAETRPMPRYKPRDRVIRSVIGKLPIKAVEDTIRRHAAGQFNAPAYKRHQGLRRQEFSIGDAVETDIEGLTGRVIDIRDARARVLMEFLGSEREIEIEVGKLVAAQ